jgi:CpeT protein
MMKNPFSALLVFILFFAGTCNLRGQTQYGSDDLFELKKLMTGQFSTERHSKEDTTYFHIHLCMHPIWEEREDGYWLYVEQAAYTSLSNPYRQRVYHLYLSEDSNSLISRVYEIKDPSSFTGGCTNIALLADLQHQILVDRPGCELFLTRTDESTFKGSTRQGACLSSWRGASWVSSDVVISPEGLTSWDRGWDIENNLMWGPQGGGYRFDKIADTE